MGLEWAEGGQPVGRQAGPGRGVWSSDLAVRSEPNPCPGQVRPNLAAWICSNSFAGTELSSPETAASLCPKVSSSCFLPCVG